jgi:Zn-dependent protease
MPFLQNIDIGRVLITIPIILLSVAIHEFAHCWMTYRLGDDTPRQQGRVTLNPLAHLDPLGTVMIVMTSITGFGIGWGKAAVFNPYNFRNPARDRMITAIAGPISNLLQMLVWGGLCALFLAFGFYGGVKVCAIGVIINAVLAIFNLLPVYPLDGHHIASYLLPQPFKSIVEHPMGMLVLLFLLFTGKLEIVLLPLLNIGYLATMYLVGLN